MQSEICHVGGLHGPEGREDLSKTWGALLPKQLCKGLRGPPGRPDPHHRLQPPHPSRITMAWFTVGLARPGLNHDHIAFLNTVLEWTCMMLVCSCRGQVSWDRRVAGLAAAHRRRLRSDVALVGLDCSGIRGGLITDTASR